MLSQTDVERILSTLQDSFRDAGHLELAQTMDDLMSGPLTDSALVHTEAIRSTDFDPSSGEPSAHLSAPDYLHTLEVPRDGEFVIEDPEPAQRLAAVIQTLELTVMDGLATLSHLAIAAAEASASVRGIEITGPRTELSLSPTDARAIDESAEEWRSILRDLRSLLAEASDLTA